MIVGLGNDIVEVARIENMLSRHSQRFLDRVFTPLEQNYCLTKKEPSIHLAARFAAKEASAKALGLGLGRTLSWKDLEICNHPSGSPFVVLSPGATHTLAQRWTGLHIHLSLSDQPCYVQAFAVATCQQSP